MEATFNEKVHIMNHPLVAHKLTIMRDENTSVKDFRELVSPHQIALCAFSPFLQYSLPANTTS